MIGDQDKLVGTLPQENRTGSPALAGQPPAITGDTAPPLPTPQSGGAPGGGPALASASPASGSANIGAPLSNEAPDQQAGAGAISAKNDLDLVQDRGTPEEYWKKNISELGSRTALEMLGDAANAASHKTGKMANMDHEQLRRDGVKANEVFGVGNTRESQDRAVEGMVYQPMLVQLRSEVETGVTDEDEAVIRMAKTMAQVQGIEDDDDAAAILATARQRVSSDEEWEEPEAVFEQAEAADPREEAEDIEPEEAPVSGEGVHESEMSAVEVTNEMDELAAAKVSRDRQTQLNYEAERAARQADKDYNRDGKKDGLWGRFKNWWGKGKDDPNTSVDESIETYQDADGNWQTRDVEVTSFMGGMTRQELATFIFQWGASMMANADKGFGTAMGLSSAGALSAHQGRQATEEATAKSDAQQKIENQLKKQTADAATANAAAATTRADAYAEGVGAVRGGVGEWKREFYRSIGWSDEKIAQAAEGILTSEQLFDEVSADLRGQREKAQSKETMNLPDNVRQKITLPDGTKVPTADLTNAQIDDLATEAAKSSIEARGALSPASENAALPREPQDDFGAAMSQYGTNTP